MDQRSAVAKLLRGQNIKLPAPHRLFPEWPRLVHPQLGDLRDYVELKLSMVYPSHLKAAKLKNADFGLFGATWWPHASYKRLQLATELSIWLFVWDDEIDSVVGAFARSVEKAEEFRRSSLAFVSHSLGLSHSPDISTSENPIIHAFESFGQHLREDCSYDQRTRLFCEIQYFMKKTEIEQQHALSGRLVSLEEYWDFRMGTSAVRVALALNEYTCGLSLPSIIIAEPDMKLIWDACNSIVSTVNDVFSARKELADNAVDSLIPIAYADNGNAQHAADVAIQVIEDSVGKLDSAADRLLHVYSEDE